MNFDSQFPYEIVKQRHVSLVERRDSRKDLQSVWLYVISDGTKLGMAYDRTVGGKCTPEYELLLRCEWDHIDICDTTYGAYLVAYRMGKCRCFSLCGCKLRYAKASDKCTVTYSIASNPLSEEQYDWVTYSKEKSPLVLLFESGNKVQYYHLRNKTWSDAYDWIDFFDGIYIVYCQNGCIECENIWDGTKFPKFDDFSVLCKGSYDDGDVFLALRHGRGLANMKSFLIFYSSKRKAFYRTDIYGQINIFRVCQGFGGYQMTGFECWTNKKWISYKAADTVWKDDDVMKIPGIQAISNLSN